MFNVLIAEDEPHLRKILAENLKGAGYTVTEAEDGADALLKFNARHFDIVITDIMMPKMDGNRLASEIRKSNADIPILMLTALGELDDKEAGFASGTDDYLVKPVAARELLMRVKALLRRYKITCEDKIELPSTELNFKSNAVSVKGQKVTLTKKEFLLLYKLLSSPDVIFTRERLLDEIWGFESESTDRTVDMHVSLLREKVHSDDYEIITVRGLGYKAVLNEKT